MGERKQFAVVLGASKAFLQRFFRAIREDYVEAGLIKNTIMSTAGKILPEKV